MKKDSDICWSCEGKKRCKKCDGKGTVQKGLLSRIEKPCKECSGKGFCRTCNGKGEIGPYKLEFIDGKARCFRCNMEIITKVPECPECGVSFEGEWSLCGSCLKDVPSDASRCEYCHAEFE
jgi:hypothetical protein